MADWIHCNKCFTRYRSNIKFYLTTCGHIICGSCETAKNNDAATKQCSVCNTSCDVIMLSSTLPPNVQCFFQPLSETMQKLVQIQAFQLKNQSGLLKNVTDKYNFAKTELRKTYKLLNDSIKENYQLKLMLKTVPGRRSSANFPTSGIGASSFMAGSIGSPNTSNFSATPTNRPRITPNSNHRQLPPHGQENYAKMMLHRQYRTPNPYSPQSTSSSQQSSVSTLTPSAGTRLSHGVFTSPQNFAMMSMSDLRLQPGNRPR